MSFDRLDPLPRRTVFDIRASGAGDASPGRLRGALAFGLASAALCFLFADAWWLGAWPLCLAIFALHALTSHFEYALDLEHDPAPRTRLALHLARLTLKALWIATAAVGLIFLLGTTLEWVWVLELLER